MNLIQRLPRFLKAIPFWSDYIDEIDNEINSFNSKIALKKNFFNPRELTTIEELRNLNRYFGFVIDTSIYSDYYKSDPDKIIDYLRSEANNMVFKIISKGTKNYHEYIFNRIQEKGFVYVMFHEVVDNRLFRALNYYNSEANMVQLDLLNHDFSLAPFTKVTPLVPSASGFISLNNLDQDLALDDSPSWTTDYTLYGMSVAMTKHISAEFVADSLFIEGSDTLLISNNYLEYLRKSLNFARKATEIPHSGLGVTAYTTNVVTTPFTIPTINVSTDVTATYVSKALDPISSIYSYFELTSDAPLTYYRQSIVETQLYQDDNFDLVNITFPVSKSNLEIIGVGNDSTDAWNTTLSYLDIEPKTIKIEYADTTDTVRTIVDDGQGHLYYPEFYSWDDFLTGSVDLSDFSIGTINYNTGNISFTTLDTTGGSVDVTPGTGEDIHISYYNHYGFRLEDLTIYNNADEVVVNVNFPTILLTKKEYHVSFLIVIDKR